MLDRRLVEELQVRELLLQGLQLGFRGKQRGRFPRGLGAGGLLPLVVHGSAILFGRQGAYPSRGPARLEFRRGAARGWLPHPVETQLNYPQGLNYPWEPEFATGQPVLAARGE